MLRMQAERRRGGERELGEVIKVWISFTISRNTKAGRDPYISWQQRRPRGRRREELGERGGGRGKSGVW